MKRILADRRQRALHSVASNEWRRVFPETLAQKKDLHRDAPRDVGRDETRAASDGRMHEADLIAGNSHGRD